MATISDELDLDLSSLDDISDTDIDPQQKDSSKKKEEAQLDLSSLDDLFPKEIQTLDKLPAKVTSGFGKRKDPYGLGIKFHNGLDMPMKLDTPVKSLGRGTVIKTTDEGNKSYGKSVTIDYGGGLELTYAHLNKIGLEVGDRVSPEALIGLSGSTGRSKGPHLHLKAMLNGKPVDPSEFLGGIHNIAVGALSDEDTIGNNRLDLSSLNDPDIEQAANAEQEKTQQQAESLDLSSLDQIGDLSVKPIEEIDQGMGTILHPKRTIEETIAGGGALLSQPKLSVRSPDEFVGNPVKTTLTVQHKLGRWPSKNDVADAWLATLGSNYVQLNSEYRAKTGNNLIELDPNRALTFKGKIDANNEKWEVAGRLTYGAKELLNAYAEARNKDGVQAGIDAVYFKNQELDRQAKTVLNELEAAKAGNKNIIAERHPYLQTAFNILSPASILLNEPDAIKSGIGNFAQSEAQLIHNVRMLPEAIYTLNRYGGDSQEYEDLLNKDREVQSRLYNIADEVYKPKTFSGMVSSGAVTGAISFPKYAALGSLGLGTLPTLTYIENIHRGNIEATKAALPMALMMGTTHGLGEFLNSGTKLYITQLDKEGNPFIKQVEIGRGLGNAAPFSRIRSELSINQNVQNAFLANESVSIGSLSPLAKNLLMRGTNAFLMGGTSAFEGADAEHTASSFIVGLTFPVGKTKYGTFEEGKVIPPLEGPKQIRIGAPPKVNQYVPSENLGEGGMLYQNIDDAALNLIDLRRALKEHTYTNTNKVGLKESVQRQVAIQKAIEVLNKQVPKEFQEYFEQNEASIRAALKTNYNAVKAKEEYLGREFTQPETKLPSEVKENPNVNVKESAIDRLKRTINLVDTNNLRENPAAASEVARDLFGDAGSSNKWITPDRAMFAFERLTNTKSKGGTTLHSVGPQDLPAIGKDLVEGSKAIWDLTQISAFYLEDFYHRKVEPSVSELANKMRVSLGDVVKGFSDNDFQKLFEAGKDIVATNIADPYFSKMKQDAIEKLPNRFTTEQARNVLAQHKDEFEWTAGLKDFLDSNKDRKISKKELVDYIQNNQVRVEESVASEEGSAKVRQMKADLDPILDRLRNKIEEIKQSSDVLKDAAIDPVSFVQWVREQRNNTYSDPRFAALLNNPEVVNLVLEYNTKLQAWQSAKSSEPKLQYSLKAYTGEKLELSGAEGSREVKLITPIMKSRDELVGQKGDWIRSPEDDNFTDTLKVGWEDKVSGNIAWTDTESLTPSQMFDPTYDAYKHSHFPDPNYVAHYRSSNRTFIDKITGGIKRMLFGEEFQSDWNHDIREHGVKATQAELNRLKELKQKTGLANWNALTPEEKIEFKKIEDKTYGNIEPNPFMQHSWKELVLKRFLRDAAVAKNPDGSYKYDSVGWTTARQQMERYGKILEGKEFKWKKNIDGTYTFELAMGEHTGLSTDGIDWRQPHELQNITLERFKELTTPEAADFVREQEAKLIETAKSRVTITESSNRFIKEGKPQFTLKDPTDLVYIKDSPEAALEAYMQDAMDRKGQFSLSETVNLRKEGSEKYADYDTALVNIAKKLGKRFGAKYSQQEIETSVDTKATALDISELPAEVMNKETVHSLEITPSMRESLEREGFSLYGTGGNEPLKYPEAGVRNRIVSADAFNQARESLVNRLREDYVEAAPTEEQANGESYTGGNRGGVVFNSGLNPDAFIDQVKLLYSGIKDLHEFASALVQRYGEPIRQYAEDFFYAIKDKAAEFNKKLDVNINNWQTDLNKLADDPAYQLRQNERGSFSLRKKKSPELEDYYSDITKHQKGIALDSRAWLRGVALAQVSDQFGKVYDTMRQIQRTVSNYTTVSTNQLFAAKKIIKAKLDAPVAEALYQGNEFKNPTTGAHQGKVWTDAELVANFNMNSKQIEAYRNVRAAIDNVLNLRLENKLYTFKERISKLTDQLAGLQKGTSKYDEVAEKILDAADAMSNMSVYYNKLKASGYVTLQRQGKIAAFIEDPKEPADITVTLRNGKTKVIPNPNKKIYNQFNSVNEANKWLQDQKASLGISSTTNAGSLYDIQNIREIATREKLSPAQFEDLLDRSNAKNDDNIEKLREEVYSKFPSYTYQLNREFVRGYDRDLQTAINSTVNQLETYASSFYSKVGKEEGVKALEATGLEKSDPNLYRISSKYIQDETTPANLNWLSKSAIAARRFTYLWQLGFDVNQLYLNAVAQPMTQTYSYFYRVKDPSGTGLQLTGLEPEQYFIKGGKLAADFKLGKADPTFIKIAEQLKSEHVLSPEFTKTFIESQTGNKKSSKLEHWASYFMRKGEETTRLHAAAEAYLIGTEKFKLAGNQLTDFMVKAVDATQSNPTRGENPFVVRSMGEGGKLIYQFMAFNQMWWENLALGFKDNKGAIRKSMFAARELAPLAIIGGMTGMPLAAFAGTLYTLSTGRDPKKDMDRFLGDDSLIERAVRYGITGLIPGFPAAAISQKLTPSAPILDSTGRIIQSAKTASIGDVAENIPVFATAQQIWNGSRQLVTGDSRTKIKGAISLLPRAIRGPARMLQTSKEGYRDASGIVLSRKKITIPEKIGQVINLTPTPVSEHYDRERTKSVRKIHRKIRKISH